MEPRALLAYADNAVRQLHETLAAHPDSVQAPFETLAAYKTIGQLVAHMVGAEQRWTEQRLYGGERPPRYEDAAPTTLVALFADWETARARTRAYFEADGVDLSRRIVTEFPNFANFRCELTVIEILFHLVNHQSTHTGQIMMALQQQGIDPPNFDYVMLKGE